MDDVLVICDRPGEGSRASQNRPAKKNALSVAAAR